jgi:hypothetical protein
MVGELDCLERNRWWPDRSAIQAFTWKDSGKSRNSQVSLWAGGEWDIVGSIVTRLHTGLSELRNLAAVREFSLLKYLQIGFGVHSASYSMGSGGFFTGVSRSAREQSPPSGAEVRNGRNCNSPPPLPIWWCPIHGQLYPYFMQQKFEPVLSRTQHYRVAVVPTLSVRVLWKLTVAELMIEEVCSGVNVSDLGSRGFRF